MAKKKRKAKRKTKKKSIYKLRPVYMNDAVIKIRMVRPVVRGHAVYVESEYALDN